MSQPRVIERSLVVTLVVSAGLALITGILASTSGLFVLSSLLPFLILGLALAGFIYLRVRLVRMADDEARERSVLPSSQTTSSLFASGEPGEEAFTVARTVSQLDRWVTPLLAPLLAVAQGLWAWNLYHAMDWDVMHSGNALAAAAYLGAQGFVLFLLHRYLLGLSREVDRSLRGPALLLGLAGYLSLLGAVACAAAHLGMPDLDEWLALAMIGLLALLALESSWNTLLILYSPKRRSFALTAYISRLSALFVDPAGWAKSLSQSVDYQFGFSFSQTWFAQFMRKAVIPFLVFQIVVVYAFSSVVVIAPHEIGLKERFGRSTPDQPEMPPGLHLKLPWPFETVQRVPTRQLLTTVIGFDHDHGVRPPIMLWTVPHYRDEYTFLTASRQPVREAASSGAVPVNLVTVNMPIEYVITNAHRFAYGFADPNALLADIAYRAVALELASRDLFDLLGPDRLTINQAIQDRMNRDLHAIDLGVAIQFTGLQGIHPPLQVAPAFQSVVGALEEKEASILLARAYANSILPTAAADAQARILAADAYRFRREQIARADADHFVTRRIAADAAPDVFRQHAYLHTLRDALVDRPKVILATSGTSPEVIMLNLEERPFTSIFELGPFE